MKPTDITNIFRAEMFVCGCEYQEQGIHVPFICMRIENAANANARFQEFIRENGIRLFSTEEAKDYCWTAKNVAGQDTLEGILLITGEVKK